MKTERVPKTISISAKCSDCFGMTVMDSNNKCIADYDGYVPSYIPGSYGDYVEVDIDIETGRITNWTNPKGDSEFNEILKGKNPKVISLSAHCSDKCYTSIQDAKGNEIAGHDGYVPSFMPNGGGYGDAVEMDIDIETGVILNWENPLGDSEFISILNGESGDSDEYDSDD